jgi:2-phospho-L-lactate/phosphoenolpyruvate guanylyltransferase
VLDQSTPWLLLPVKSLSHGKRRLAPFLSHLERRDLNEYFLRRTINIAAEFPGVQRTAVISEADDTLTLARELGVYTIRQTDGRGLNHAAAQGTRELYAHGARSLLILPIDLPLLLTHDLYEIATLGRQHEVVICPDKHHAGTNAIFFSAPTSMRFSFGPRSYLQHQRETQRCGLVPHLYHNPRIARDIDLPEDLIDLRGQALLLASILRPVG